MKLSTYLEKGWRLGVGIILINQSAGWYYYYLPKRLKSKLWGGKFLGQKQKWFLFSFEGLDEEINLQADKKPEFNKWKWVSPQDVLDKIVVFKKEIYHEVLKEFNFV